MKYAFILGSNAFIVPNGSISYTDGQHQAKSFLSIRSIYHDTAVDSHLAVELDISDLAGAPLILSDNRQQGGEAFHVKTERDRVLISQNNGDTVIDIHQIDNESAMRLEHNIIAELEVNAPVAVIRIRGNFMVNGTPIEIDNEKLFINGNSIANSVLAGHDSLQFAENDVVL